MISILTDLETLQARALEAVKCVSSGGTMEIISDFIDDFTDDQLYDYYLSKERPHTIHSWVDYDTFHTSSLTRAQTDRLKRLIRERVVIVE